MKSTNYDDSYETPVLTPGKSFILGYTNETDGIYDASQDNVIIFDDFTTATKYVDFKFKVKSSAMKILVLNNKNEYNIKYFYYLLQTIKPKVDTHKRFWITEYAQLIISVPPKWYQNLVVDFLEIIYSHIIKIENEKKIMINYVEMAKHKILDDIFGENSSYKSYYEKTVKFSELFDTISTTGIEIKTRNVLPSGMIPVVSQSQHLIDGYVNFAERSIDNLPVVVFGDHTRKVKYIDFKFYPGADGIKVLKAKKIDDKFFYYCTLYASEIIDNNGYARHFSKLKEVPINLPNLETQRRLANYLDTSFSILNSIL